MAGLLGQRPDHGLYTWDEAIYRYPWPIAFQPMPLEALLDPREANDNSYRPPRTVEGDLLHASILANLYSTGASAHVRDWFVSAHLSAGPCAPLVRLVGFYLP